MQELQHVMQLLIQGRGPLPPEYADHPLRGQWADCRDCHIRGDWLLVYRIVETPDGWHIRDPLGGTIARSATFEGALTVAAALTAATSGAAEPFAC